MRANTTVWTLVVIGTALAASASGAAEAKGRASHGGGSAARGASFHSAGYGTKGAHIGGRGHKYASLLRGASYSYGSGLQCVPFARENSGIELAGNAWAWWSAADGVYERGSRPEIGSVLNFRANGHMHSGHVAVVSNVENARVVDIDHANWANHGGISRNVRVVDVSPMNDWSAVRVALPGAGDFGSVYPTYGFIYDRPDRGTMIANSGSVPMPNALNPAPRDLRPMFVQVASSSVDSSADEPVEVAEATVRGSYRHGHARRSAAIHRVKARDLGVVHHRKHMRG